MPVLSSSLRKLLERAVVDGRGVAENGAAAALSRLGVGMRDAPGHLAVGERSLRNGLRARARQLGDRLEYSANPSDVWVACPLLVGEVAYEQWHRFLFARFLDVNGLLRHPEYGVPVSLEDCAELAEELGEPDAWSVATRFAAGILPGIFKPADPAVAVDLAREDLLALERAVTELPDEVFTAEDSLGWVYQFWQSKAKETVNATGRKIGGADLSPVTQLFTEDYMVRFLLENSLGAWWAVRHPDSPLLGGYEFLRVTDAGDPVAGKFESWPDKVADVTVMDPCCGSGHFLVGAFGMLWKMRAEEEGLSPAAAQDAVLAENLFGLELDPRCTQIAMFALALEAWKQGGFRVLPLPQVACSGIPAKAPLSEWTKLAEGDYQLEAALTRLHSLFADADTLGSLIDPVRVSEQAGSEQAGLDSVDWADISPLLDRALVSEAGTSGDPVTEVFGEAAAGIARAADFLSRSYTLVATNVPYLGMGRQDTLLANYCASEHPLSKGDLATTMLERWRRSVIRQGTLALVTPQTWLFLKTYKSLRQSLLESDAFHLIARLGPGAFETIGGEVVQAALLLFSSPALRGDNTCSFLDASPLEGVNTKAKFLRNSPMADSSQLAVRAAANSVLAPVGNMGHRLLSEVVDVHYGSKPGQTSRVKRFFWEMPQIEAPWVRLESVPARSGSYSGKSQVVLHPEAAWKRGVSEFGIRGSAAWGLPGVVVSRTSQLNASLYCGEIFDDNAYVITPRRNDDLPAIYSFLRSPEFAKEVRIRNQKLGVDTGSMVNVPFDDERWSLAAAEGLSGGIPAPRSSDATQWLFNGSPCEAQQPLQVAVARLLGFQWPGQKLDTVDALVDGDGIVCLPAVSGEQAASERLRAVLATSYGDNWSNSYLDELLIAAGGKAGDLAGWVADVFFKDHCKVFSNRPFIWHIWDGRRDGFSALVNYHLLDRAMLERLTYRTLGWWIDRQRADSVAMMAGAEVRLAAALALQEKLKLILAGDPPYDIYTRWKGLAEQPVGWDPDLDDGVRLNIRPFVQSGVLRSKFTINWKSDRGTSPDGTERHNDLHFSVLQKRKAREAI